MTRSIPGYKDGFTEWNELYGEGKLCFMQSKGKWTTNKTMKEWFTGYIIPRIMEDKQRRRDAGQQVSPTYVVILDGLSTHCLTQKDGVESWITLCEQGLIIAFTAFCELFHPVQLIITNTILLL